MPTGRSILLVSDEGVEREAALEVLRSANGDGKVCVMQEQAAALRFLATEKVDCVFCYARDGAEQGVNFLTEVWHRAPASGRFVIARSIDADTQIRCAFGAHHYLSAPLDGKAVEAALAIAKGREAILPGDRVQLMIARMRSLPSRPKIYFQVLRELDSRQANAREVAALIQEDPGIASKMIQVVNSIFYGRAEAVADMEEAVLFLGFEVTASIVLSLEAISRFEKIERWHRFTEEVWAHSQKLAELTRRICQSFGQNRAACDQAYLAGLLHDIGKLVLARNFPEEYQEITRRAEEQSRPLIDVEREVLGVSHADAGAYLLAVWGLPVKIFQAVAFHHARSSGNELSPGLAVQIAEEIVESGRPVDEIISAYPAELGLDKHVESLRALGSERSGAAGELPNGKREDAGVSFAS